MHWKATQHEATEGPRVWWVMDQGAPNENDPPSIVADASGVRLVGTWPVLDLAGIQALRNVLRAAELRHVEICEAVK